MSARTPIPMAKQILFSLVAFALAWIICEVIILGYAWLKPKSGTSMQFLYAAHPHRAFTPVPNTMDRNKTRTYNAQGIRGPVISVEKPPDSVRIVCLGGSTTYTDGASTDSQTYPAQMERVLRRHYANAPFRIEVINAGVQAYVSIESLGYFQTRLLDFSPDIVVLLQAVNDSWFMIGVPDFQTDYTHVRRTFAVPPLRWWEYSPLLSWLLAKNSMCNPYFPDPEVNLNALVLTRPSLAFPGEPRLQPITGQMATAYERNVRSFIYVARGNGVVPVLATEIFRKGEGRDRVYYLAVERLNVITREVAARESVPLIDFARAMAWSEENFYDACHLHDKPTALGRMAEIFAEALVQSGAIERAYSRRQDTSKPQQEG